MSADADSQKDEHEAAFDVVDVLEGFCSLSRRSPTLDGRVPLRVARACVPLLEGNAFGFQLSVDPRHRIDLRRRLTGHVVRGVARSELLARLHRAARPRLVTEGLIPELHRWGGVLDGHLPIESRALTARDRPPIALFTGLMVRPRQGIWLRVSTVKNRRSLAYSVREAILDDPGQFTPLVVEIDPLVDELHLSGEIATLAVLPANVRVESRSLSEGRDVIEKHLAFYDRAYFEAKKQGETTRKYRSEASRRKALAPATRAGLPDETLLESFEATVRTLEPAHATLVHRPSGPAKITADAPDRVVFRNPVAFAASFDGKDLTVTPDPVDLARFAAAVTADWSTLLDRWGAPHHQGALLYLSKYFTPHPPGEPHFFVKPPALFRTTPGVSLLLEGVSGAGFEVLRGVVETDAFHAAPAVFELTAPGRIEVPAGTPLLSLLPINRSLAARGFLLRKLTLGERDVDSRASERDSSWP